MIILLSFILGAIVGSFLNVVVFRLHSGKSFIRGRSACRSCGRELRAGDLIPILSFAFLRGRCRYCKTRLSWQYPFVETVTGMVFALIAYQWAGSLATGIFLALVSCFLIVVAVFDFKHFLILDKVVLPGAVLAFLGNLVLDLSVSCSPWSWQCRTLPGVAGAAVISGFFLMQYLLSKGSWIGFGDVKYGILLGLSVGFPGAILLLFTAYLAGAAVGIALIISGRKRLSSRLPFGTFLSFSAIITLLYGTPIMDWYSRLIGLK